MFDMLCSFCGSSLCSVTLLRKEVMARMNKNETNTFMLCLLDETVVKLTPLTS